MQAEREPGDDAEVAATAYANDRRRLGRDVTLSGLYGALHQSGVEAVTLHAPVSDIVVGPTEAASLTAITVTGVIGNV